MRPAIRWQKPLLESCKSSTRRYAAPCTRKTPKPSSLICNTCRAPLSQPSRELPSPRRFRSSTASASTARKAEDNAILHQQQPRSHYDFFPKTLPGGAPPAGPFHIDLRALRKEFLQLQAIAHPDRHPASLKARAEGTSALINEAYRTLQNPLLRAQYCLSLQGINVADNETAKTQDAELLMKVMEVREEIEDAEEGSELLGLERENNTRIAESEKRIEGDFKRGDIKGVEEEAVRLRYWVNIKESIDDWEVGKPIVLNH